MNSKTRLNFDLIKEKIEEIIKSSDDYIIELGLYLNKILNSNQIIDFRVNVEDGNIKKIIREYRINQLLDKENKNFESFDKIIGEKINKSVITNPVNPFLNIEHINILLNFPNDPEIIVLNIDKIINNSII